MLSSLPVVTHNGPVFQWIAKGTSAQLIDMSRDGELSRMLIEMISGTNKGNSRDRVSERFSWERLIPMYLEMYQRVAKNPAD